MANLNDLIDCVRMISPAISQAAAVTALTDNSGGAAADGTIGIVSYTPPSWDEGSPTDADANAIGAAFTACKAAIAELAAKQNAVIAALKSAGIMDT